jgi:FkbM family methyltransferase
MAIADLYPPVPTANQRGNHLRQFSLPNDNKQMNLFNSTRAFYNICLEDADFRALGRPFGWSVFFHYLGRWYDRRKVAMPTRNVPFSYHGRHLEFEMTNQYTAALKDIFKDNQYDCAREFGQSPSRILDLGGNIGLSSVFFSKAFPEAKLAVVEPDPRNLTLLRKNLGLNGASAMVVDGAVGHRAGTLTLRYGVNPTCSSTTLTEWTAIHELVNEIEVPVTTVPKVMEQAGWDHIDLLKIDIEGAEEELLSRDNQWLAKVEAIIMEVHANTTIERLNGHLAPFGFILTRFGGGREPVYFAKKKLS